MRKSTSVVVATTILAIAVLGCGGSGPGIGVSLLPLSLVLTPGLGYSGDPSPFVEGAPVVTSDVDSQTATITSGDRRLRLKFPTTELVDGQTFWSSQGEAEAAYEEGVAGRSHGIHTWMSTALMNVRKGPKGATVTFSGPDNWIAVGFPGGVMTITGTTQGDGLPIQIAPVGPGGSLLMQNPFNFNGGTTNWTGTATFQRDPTGLEAIIYAENNGNRTLYIVLGSNQGPFIPQMVNPPERVILEEVIGGVTHRWLGNGGTVVPTYTTFPAGQYSINAVPLAPDQTTPATGTLTVNGVIIHP